MKGIEKMSSIKKGKPLEEKKKKGIKDQNR